MFAEKLHLRCFTVVFNVKTYENWIYLNVSNPAIPVLLAIIKALKKTNRTNGKSEKNKARSFYARMPI